MSVPDWPTTYGYNMYYFPWQDWVGGIFYEHSHRLVASGVVTLLTFLAVWMCFQERVWLRWTALAIPIYGLLEAILGGIRVVQAKDWIGILHGSLAQLIFSRGFAHRFVHFAMVDPSRPQDRSREMDRQSRGDYRLDFRSARRRRVDAS